MDIDEMKKPQLIFIKDLHRLYKSNKIVLPIWQREDKWTAKYKCDLINSIQKGRMIPLIYFSKIKGEDDIRYIIDGGHRIRSICEYIDGSKKLNSTKKGKFIDLSDEEKSFFNNYPLAIHTYVNIDDAESRDIFNELQHSRPMTNAEICNSNVTILMDYLREMKNLVIYNDRTLEDILASPNNKYPKPDNHNYLPTVIQMFSFFDSCDAETIYDCKGGGHVVDYTRNFTREDNLTIDYKNEFDSSLINFFTIVDKLNHKHNVQTLNSIYHYLVWYKIDNINTFINELNIKLLRPYSEYEKIKIQINQHNKLNNQNDVRKLEGKIQNIDNLTIDWYDSAASRSSKYNNGRAIRHDILKEMFNYNVKDGDTIEQYTFNMKVIDSI